MDSPYLDRLRGIASNVLGMDKEEVSSESNLVKDFDADSLDVVEFVMEVETAFNVAIDDSEIDKLKTIDDYCKFIEKNK